MQKKTSKVRDVKVGDLVYHILYGKEWIGILLDIIEVYGYDERKRKNRNTSSLLKQIPKRVSTLVWTSKTMNLYFPKYSTGLNMVTKNR